MAYQLYRNTTLGNTLQETLDELIQVIITLIATSLMLNHPITFFLLMKKIIASFLVWTNYSPTGSQSSGSFRSYNEQLFGSESKKQADIQGIFSGFQA